MVMAATPKNAGSSWVRSVRRVTTPKLPPPPPFSAQNRSGLRAGIGDPHGAVGGDDFGFEQRSRRRCRRSSSSCRTRRLDQAGDADGAAAAALHVAAAAGGHGVVGVHPDRAGADRDRRLRRVACAAALGDERVVERDVVHPARPDQQRVGRVRGAQVAVAAALHDQPQVVVAREIHRRDDVLVCCRPPRRRRSAAASRHRSSRRSASGWVNRRCSRGFSAP